MLIRLDDGLGQAVLFHGIADAFEAGAYILDEITQLSVNIYHRLKRIFQPHINIYRNKPN